MSASSATSTWSADVRLLLMSNNLDDHPLTAILTAKWSHESSRSAKGCT